MPRAPQPTDFPPSLQLSILTTSPPNPRSLLILLHGLGDSHAPLSTLGTQLNLPSTATLSLKGPSPIPALFMGTDTPGWHWGDDILLDQGTGEVELDSGFAAAGGVLGEVLGVVLGKEGNGKGGSGKGGLGFEARDVFLWGFGQGGMVALSLAEAVGVELGGVVAIGGKLPSSKSAMAKAVELAGADALGKKVAGGKAKTPVLLCGGNRHTAVTATALQDVKARFEAVTYVKWEREGDAMARNREEMLPIMKFLAQRLRQATPVGMEEVGGVRKA